MPLPALLLDHLKQEGYHSRSNKHSNAAALAVVSDLVARCPGLAARARAGQVVYQLNMDLRFGSATWNVDLVLGSPATPLEPADGLIARATPASVHIALEIKSVMTEHRKAVQNRKRDFEAHHEHVHNYNRRTIAAGLMVVNAAERFQSPLRASPTVHGNRDGIVRLVEHCVREMRNVTGSGGSGNFGMDAKGLIVIDMDNLNWRRPDM